METVGQAPGPRSLDEAESIDRAARETASAIVRRRAPAVAT
jgi:hypothetical protein